MAHLTMKTTMDQNGIRISVTTTRVLLSLSTGILPLGCSVSWRGRRAGCPEAKPVTFLPEILMVRSTVNLKQ
jgi:hypothetical protein